MTEQKESAASGRIIGLDLHPDVFSAAALAGRDAATAKPVQQWDRLATAQLEAWAKTLAPGDLVVLEASGNSFESCERLKRCGVPTVVLESQRAGQIRKTYCANDRVDAVKLARIYLSGLAQSVWQPDAATRQRREVLHAYRKAVTTATRTRNRLKSFLSDHGIRLKPGVRLVRASGQKTVRDSRTWSALQLVLVEQMLEELKLADERRARLSAAIARKLTVSIWYMLRGLFTPLKQVDASLQVKLAKIATTIGVKTIRHLGYKSKAAFIEEKTQWLLNTA